MSGVIHNYELLRLRHRIDAVRRAEPHAGMPARAAWRDTGGTSVRIVQQALYLEVAERLRAMIGEHALPSGAWIDEVALAGELGISRTPLREALKVLAAEGLVRLEPRRGCVVNELSEQDLDEIFPLMALLEGRCAYEAARKASAADLDALEGLHAELADHARAGRIDAYYETNYQIHEAIQRLAGNRWLSGLISDLRKVLRLSRHKSLKLPGRIQESCAEHLSVFSALKAHDPEGAEALMKTHLLRQRAALKTLDAEAPHVPPARAAQA